MPISDRSDDYPLKRDYRASYRLNYGHFHHTAITGYLLHPSIPVPDIRGDNFRIADLGCGTGIWSIYAARYFREITNVRIDCFDISAEQFPPEPWRSADVHFHEHDCFKPFPAEFLGQFDVVFVRFWLTFVKDNDVGGLLQCFRSLLKPGGHLSWQEPVFDKSQLIKKNPKADSNITEEMSSLFGNLGDRAWPIRLPQLLEDAGYDNIARSEYTIPDELRPIGEPYSLAGMLESDIVSRDIKERAIEKHEEFVQGVTFDTAFQIVVGRKRF